MLGKSTGNPPLPAAERQDEKELASPIAPTPRRLPIDR